MSEYWSLFSKETSDTIKEQPAVEQPQETPIKIAKPPKVMRQETPNLADKDKPNKNLSTKTNGLVNKVKKLIVNFRETQGNSQILEAELKKNGNAWAAPSSMASFKKAQSSVAKDDDNTMTLLQKLSLDNEDKILKKMKSEAIKNKQHDSQHADLLEQVLGLEPKVKALQKSIERLEKQRQDQPSP